MNWGRLEIPEASSAMLSDIRTDIAKNPERHDADKPLN
jgi:hypothetical protein